VLVVLGRCIQVIRLAFEETPVWRCGAVSQGESKQPELYWLRVALGQICTGNLKDVPFIVLTLEEILGPLITVVQLIAWIRSRSLLCGYYVLLFLKVLQY